MREKESSSLNLITLIVIGLVIIFIILVLFAQYYKNVPQNQISNKISVNNEIENQVENQVENKVENKEEINSEENNEENLANKVNEYILDIYYGTDTWMPEFDNINSADEDWLWECAYTNMYNLEGILAGDIVSKEQIEESAKQVFGNEFNKEFPKTGLEFWLEPKDEGYFLAATSVELEYYYDYELISVENTNNSITAKLVEFKYNEIYLGEPDELNLYNIKTDKIIKTYDLAYTEGQEGYEDINQYKLEKEEEARNYVKNNIEEFSIATVTLELDEETDSLYITSVER